MHFEEDISRRIDADFGDNSSLARQLLNEAIGKTAYLKASRVIRCIIYLANGNINHLHKYIEAATFDTRDIMLWAEYEDLGGDFNYKRIRDFNKTFEESTNNVAE